jgi:hypothetical protein
MPDAADIADFLAGYVEACVDAGTEPLPVVELAALLRSLNTPPPPLPFLQ